MSPLRITNGPFKYHAARFDPVLKDAVGFLVTMTPEELEQARERALPWTAQRDSLGCHARSILPPPPHQLYGVAVVWCSYGEWDGSNQVSPHEPCLLMEGEFEGPLVPVWLVACELKADLRAFAWRLNGLLEDLSQAEEVSLVLDSFADRAPTFQYMKEMPLADFQRWVQYNRESEKSIAGSVPFDHDLWIACIETARYFVQDFLDPAWGQLTGALYVTPPEEWECLLNAWWEGEDWVTPTQWHGLSIHGEATWQSFLDSLVPQKAPARMIPAFNW
jgi:hypothetical protein